MSYAEAAAKGPKQSPEEARAPAPPAVEHTDSPTTSSLIDVDTDSVHTVPSDFTSQAIQTETQADRYEHEAAAAKARAEEELNSKKEAAKKKAKDAKAKAKKEINRFEANSDNPVFVGNAIAVAALSAGLGFGAYKKYSAGELSWQVVGAWAGVVGAFAVGDYYLSRYLFKNKYPPKN
ncbi:Uncharacterized protein BP5553_09373 [Venustampulla echinocandica]|uniref:Uncharacterized protein n=1 Tax=Venustampulla echinocandica TaxID=2656787 RepID=A0A370TCL4_9HELO|nr:Uncharacterized protein BP5553_09373 [Venustampulla echinocandica]RDL31971.1 Uncharacterized protein BP5553_09373 [Venustampulla echinocandica]